MFDFNALRDDPAGLMDLLEEFMVTWYNFGPPDPTTYRTALSAVPMPDPLRRVYQIAEWWGIRYWDDAFASSHEILYPFNTLKVDAERLIFSSVIEGLWECATQVSGADAPVWVQVEEQGWEFLTPSLAQFLVDHCLQDVASRASYVVRSGDLVRRFEAAGREVQCIWEGYDNCLPDHFYVGPRSFHLVDGRILVRHDIAACATDSREARAWLQDFFHDDGWSNGSRMFTRVHRDVFTPTPGYTPLQFEDPFASDDEKNEFWINRQAMENELNRAQDDAQEYPKKAAWAAARAEYLKEKLKELYPD